MTEIPGSEAVRRVGVVGAGQMGTGIALAIAKSGIEVLLHDFDPRVIERTEANVTGLLDRLVQRGRMAPEERRAAETNVGLVWDLDAFEDCDFVIEAVTESEPVKLDLFRKLDRVCRPGVVLASNTSSISITRLGRESGRPGQVIGMHFMNPPLQMPLVEIVIGLATDPATHETTERLARRLGKETLVSGDSPGFIVNRILLPMINEAVYCAMEGVATIEDIDTAMKRGTNHPMGPLELADLIGLDTCLAIMEVMHRVFGDDKYRPCPLLKRHVDAGYLGRKTGRGFYDYASGQAIPGSHTRRRT
ncbi:MAG: 3-hydroxybutyryl-CoA dehydrogenase [Proteobacteria bacterium]|nr:MAG: 3-hydroxybutyryl-CoA dehydrogenase [Pseudomonadota bacterium]